MPIRLRLVLLAGIAILAMAIATWLGISRLNETRHNVEREVLHNKWAHDCSSLIHYLQRERGASASFIASSLKDFDTVKKMRSDSSAALEALFNNPLATEHRLARLGMADLRVKLMEVRNDVEHQSTDWRRLRDAYTTPINTLLGAVSYEMLHEVDTFSPKLDMIAELALAREALGLLRATVNSVRTQASRNTSDLIFIAGELTLYRHHIDVVRSHFAESDIHSLRSAIDTPDHAWVMEAINRVLSKYDMVAALPDGEQWWERSTKVIDSLKTLEDQLFDQLARETMEKGRAQKNVMLWVSAGMFAMLLVLVSFVTMTITVMMRDLRELSTALDQIVEKENYAIRLKDRGGRDEWSHAFQHFNRLLEFTDRLIREKETLASMDTLTGVMNRRAFLKYAQREITRANRYGHNLSLIFLDIDHFKRINDTCGHATGDEVLKMFVDTVKTRSRDTDLISRWGGEEFIIMTPDTGIDGAQSFAESVRQCVAAAEFPGIGHVTCSFGVTQWKRGETFEAFCSRADVALYEAKQSGRNRVCVG
ncbi:diguanylate cyclase [Dechloromonas sp. XY25]|uniref:diguanylate cyclase n=1 Tax=Dechloromonas hankyongensis TaxID=2908002 RepID=A0ABS9K182_9RHOO|nr:diguanylate cyclase [Dechloromonas hankyongensis]MCG2576918.1 diguanylate cyclase [Dechloromonas hankyongensis]